MTAPTTTTLRVNGRTHVTDAPPETPLLFVLRDDLGLDGAKFGCGLGQCGSCTVTVEGRPVLSCLAPVAAMAGRAITTVEGLGSPEAPGPLQRAFIAENAAQCGYCIAGMVMRAHALLLAEPDPDEARIRAAMRGNLCRCGTHMRILAAIRRAAAEMRAGTARADRRGGNGS